MGPIKRCLSRLLCLALLLGMLPAAAQAEGETHWAQSAVDTLNTIYGAVFSTDEVDMTVADAREILEAMGSPTDKLTGQDSDLFTRAQACEVLSDAFALQTADGQAISFLYDKNIINGESPDNLNENGPVSKAEFAVLTYRVLNYTGSGLGTSSVLRPGTDEYFAWMYLAVRRSVPFAFEQTDAAMDSVSGFNTYKLAADTDYTDGRKVPSVQVEAKAAEAIWDAWAAALSEPKIGGLSGFQDDLAEEEAYDGKQSMVDAATRMMSAYISAYTIEHDTAPTIFTDVTPGDWWYDGVMYSFDAGYVRGLGNGSFEPDCRLPLYELASMLYRINPIENVEDIDLPFLAHLDPSTYEGGIMQNSADLQKAMKAAVQAGYLSWADGRSEDFDPTATVSRKDAIADILKACADGAKIDLKLNEVNTAVLDRFTDVGGLSPEQEQYLAYAVSHGMVSGTDADTLSPESGTTRAQAVVLVYRTLLGLDQTKMHDYGESVRYVLGGNET